MAAQGNPTDVMGNRAIQTAQAIPDAGLGSAAQVLTAALQTTLDIEQLLQIFAYEAGRWVNFDALRFQNSREGLHTEIGQAERHRCTYRLTLLDENLGELAVSRSRRFTERELERLETLLCALLHPLRNALRYLCALRAAHRDPLTGAENRAALEQALEREVKLARRHQQPLTLITMDLDNFKQVNDRYGHIVGDCVLKRATECAQSAIRDSDLLFRYGGEEFVILLSNTPAGGALHVAERIRARLAEHSAECGDYGLTITASLGVAELEDGESGMEFMHRADTAMYRAKRTGRNRVVLAAPYDLQL
jgi:diguanylate cyclase (GGDEF)-like protein